MRREFAKVARHRKRHERLRNFLAKDEQEKKLDTWGHVAERQSSGRWAREESDSVLAIATGDKRRKYGHTGGLWRQVSSNGGTAPQGELRTNIGIYNS